jgi:hypothetical protein
MFRVDWLQSALDELATIWTGGDSSLRTAVTAATHAVEQRLRANASAEGESRTGGRRIMFAPPLALTFQVESDGVTATVLHVRLFRRRGK